MNKDIKFKAWMPVLNKMETGLFGLRSDGQASFNTESILLRFTGMKDKEEKDIYEGDILQDQSGDISEVVFDLGCFWMKSPNKDLSSEDKYQYYPMYKYASSLWCNLIGNVYEHHHLLSK